MLGFQINITLVINPYMSTNVSEICGKSNEVWQNRPSLARSRCPYFSLQIDEIALSVANNSATALKITKSRILLRRCTLQTSNDAEQDVSFSKQAFTQSRKGLHKVNIGVLAIQATAGITPTCSRFSPDVVIMIPLLPLATCRQFDDRTSAFICVQLPWKLRCAQGMFGTETYFHRWLLHSTCAYISD